LYLLLLDETPARNLVDRRFGERRAGPFALPPSLAEVWNELAIVLDLDLELGQPICNLRRRLLDDLVVTGLYVISLDRDAPAGCPSSRL
jgi:hypothetical protein